MATTVSTRPDRRLRRCVRAGVAGGALLAAATAGAASFELTTGVGTRLEWTSNADFGLVGEGRSDVIATVRPRLAVRAEGARLRLNGTAALAGVAYADHTQPSGLRPEADLSARLEAVERLVFLEAALRARRVTQNPFGATADSASATNSVTATEARFSPYVDGRLPGELRYGLRADNSWVREIGARTGVSKTAGYFGHYEMHLERDPRPLGFRLEATRDFTRYEADDVPSVGLGLARATLTYALMEDLRVGIRAGRERSDLIERGETRSTQGAELRWTPSPRTTVEASRDKRFFGNAWQLAASHRMPWLALTLNGSRALDTAPQSLFELPPAADVAALLDAMFTTRFPDPAERARVVRDLIDRNGLPESTTAPSALLFNRISLLTSMRLGAVLSGARNTVSLSLFRQRAEDATGNNPLANGDPQANNVQTGTSLSLSQRLAPSVSASLGLDWARTRAVGSSGLQTTQRGLSLQLSLDVSPKTSAVAGARVRRVSSTAVTNGNESAVFAGLDHRF